MRPLPKLGVGLAFQAPLAPMIEAAGDDLDYIEVVPDILWTDRGPAEAPRYIDDAEGLATLLRVARGRPIVAHGIGMSIGSAGHFDRGHVAQVGRWNQQLCFPWHSDHLAWHLAVSEGGRMDVGITMPLPRDAATLEMLEPHIREVQARVAAPFLLENSVCYFDIPDGEMDEPTFLNRLCRMSGCGLVLDLHNLHTNARNHGFDAFDLLAELELDHVGELHVAGGMELDGFDLDAHSDTVPDPVWALLERALPRCPNVGGLTFELFGSRFDSVVEERVRRDLRRMKAMWRSAGHGRAAAGSSRPAPRAEPRSAAA